MLNRTGNTNCKVYVRTNGLAGLTNLQIFRFPARVNNCTGTAHRTAKHLCQIFQNLEVLRAADTTATGNKNLRIHNIHGIRNSFYHVENFNIFVVRCKSRIILFYNSLRTFDWLNFLHNACTNGCHLRTVIRTCDCSNRISAERRTRH